MADKIETDNKSIDKGMQESGTKASSLAGPTDADADDGTAFGSGALDATAFGMDKDPLPPGSGSSELAGDADDLELSRRLANDPTSSTKARWWDGHPSTRRRRTTRAASRSGAAPASRTR